MTVYMASERSEQYVLQYAVDDVSARCGDDVKL